LRVQTDHLLKVLYKGIKRRRKDLLSKVTKYQRSGNSKLIYVDKSYNFLKICNQIKDFQNTDRTYRLQVFEHLDFLNGSI